MARKQGAMEGREKKKKRIYHGIIGESRRANQGALSDYFLPYHPKWWKRRGVNYQAAADCQPGILMVIIGGPLMVYLAAPIFPIIAFYHAGHRSKLMALFRHLLFIGAPRAAPGIGISKILKCCMNHNFR